MNTKVGTDVVHGSHSRMTSKGKCQGHSEKGHSHIANCMLLLLALNYTSIGLRLSGYICISVCICVCVCIVFVLYIN